MRRSHIQEKLKDIDTVVISSKIHLSNSDSILKDIKLLILERKKLEKEFAVLRKKLLQRKTGTIINSSNWEEWKILSMEYDEIKKIIRDIDERYLALKKLRHELKKHK